MFTHPFSKLFAYIVACMLSVCLTGCGSKTESGDTSSQETTRPDTAMPEATTENQKIFSTLGFSIGKDLMFDARSSDEVEYFIAGLRMAASDNEPAYANELRDKAFQMLNDERSKREQDRLDSEVTVNKAAGEAFLSEIDAKAGVVKTDSGLRYEILAEGSDTFANSADSVSVHYHGTLIDGTVFDSSVQRGEPVTFPLNGVIQGFSEGLTLVGEGGKIRLYMPSDIAYGDGGAGGAIGPGATLIFEVELLEINP